MSSRAYHWFPYYPFLYYIKAEPRRASIEGGGRGTHELRSTCLLGNL